MVGFAMTSEMGILGRDVAHGIARFAVGMIDFPGIHGSAAALLLVTYDAALKNT